MKTRLLINMFFVLILICASCNSQENCSFNNNDDELIENLLEPYKRDSNFKLIKYDLSTKLPRNLNISDFVFIEKTGIYGLGQISKRNLGFLAVDKKDCKIELILIPANYNIKVYENIKQDITLKNPMELSLDDFEKSYVINDFPFQERLSVFFHDYPINRRMIILELVLSHFFYDRICLYKNDKNFDHLKINEEARSKLLNIPVDTFLMLKDKNGILLFFYWNEERSFLEFVLIPTSETIYFNTF